MMVESCTTFGLNATFISVLKIFVPYICSLRSRTQILVVSIASFKVSNMYVTVSTLQFQGPISTVLFKKIYFPLNYKLYKLAIY